MPLFVSTAPAVDPYPRIVGQYYGPAGNRSSTGYTNGNGIRGGLINLGMPQSFDRISCNVASAGGAGATVRLGVYACDANGTPGALELDAGTIDSSGTGLKEITIALTLPAGIHYLGAICEGTGGCSLINNNSGNGVLVPIWDSGGSTVAGFTLSNTTSGALPGTSGGATPVANYPIVAMRRA